MLDMFGPEIKTEALTQEKIIQGAYRIFRSHGLVFFEKRAFEIPKVSDARLRFLVDGGRADRERSHIEYLQEYLGMVRISAPFLFNEEARREYLKFLERTYGRYIVDIWDKNNQFRGNRSATAVMIIQSLGFSISKNGHGEISNSLKEQSTQAHLAMKGSLSREFGLPSEEYRFCPGIGGKIKIMDFIENRVSDSLNILSDTPLPQPRL